MASDLNSFTAAAIFGIRAERLSNSASPTAFLLSYVISISLDPNVACRKEEAVSFTALARVSVEFLRLGRNSLYLPAARLARVLPNVGRGGELIRMNGKVFLECVAKIVGIETAERYAKRIGDLDKPHTNTILGYEALAFYVYSTGVSWHDHINGSLWSGNASPEVLQFVDVLNRALGKLPPYVLNEGLVYRGYRTDDAEALAARYTVGQVVRFPGFTSAAFREEDAFYGNVLFTIRALTARRIWFLAADYYENEVLIPAGRSFQVVDVTTSYGRAAIFLDELP
ncbi:MAG: hypothetical protein E5W92_19850 [Mesorhizobium sp.]|nr:MAG: hypothetical protein E5W92_19850 [Mesorhizobium sp.]